METERIALSQREWDRLKVLHEVKQKHLTQVAAERLKIADRQVRRMLLRIGEHGDGAELEARNPGQYVAMGISGWRKTLSPGADVHAVHLRFSLLRVLKYVNEVEVGKVPGFVDGKPDDAIFELFATGNALFEFRKIMTVVDPRGAGITG